MSAPQASQGPLAALLARLGLSQKAAAKHCMVSPASMSALCRHGVWPLRGREVLYGLLVACLTHHGATGAQVRAALHPGTKNKAPRTANAGGLAASLPTKASVSPNLSNQSSNPFNEAKDDLMLLAKQTLSEAARKQFKLFRDPFTDDVEDAKDVFITPDIRFVRESMWSTVRHGGMLGVVGESGSGKSTLRRDLLDRIQRERANVVVIEPYVLAMEENDAKGKTLKSAHITEAIISAINPLATPKRSPQARFAQLHQLLKDSHRASHRHVLVIEEAHCLPTATLKHLKRFFELEDGFKKLLSIILVGQPELRGKLSEKNPEVREVVQRCELVELPPLDSHLGPYVDFKLARLGIQTADLLDKGAIDALRAKLTFSSPTAGRARAFGQVAQQSLLYPLAVANVLTAALNLAATLGAPLVTADVLREV